MTTQPAMERRQVYRILKRHDGVMAEIARRLEPPVNQTTLSQVLRGKATSRRIFEAAHAKALELLQKEQSAA